MWNYHLIFLMPKYILPTWIVPHIIKYWKHLSAVVGVIKREIASAKMMRIIPWNLPSTIDDMEEKADHLEEIFQKIHQEKKAEEEETDEVE